MDNLNNLKSSLCIQWREENNIEMLDLPMQIRLRIWKQKAKAKKYKQLNRSVWYRNLYLEGMSNRK